MSRSRAAGAFVASLLIAPALFVLLGAEPAKDGSGDWAVNMSNIEACSCQVFCPCYFVGSPMPGGHAMPGRDMAAMDAFCRFNNAFKINSGHSGDTKLDGLKFWMAGDLGGHFADGFDWAVMTFEPSATPAQRDAVRQIVKALFPGTWKSFTDGQDAAIDWRADDDGATATLDGGKAAEIQLKAMKGTGDKPVVIQNLKFWASPRNDGFKVMPAEKQAYRAGGNRSFETTGTNGFVVTIDMKSSDVAVK